MLVCVAVDKCRTFELVEWSNVWWHSQNKETRFVWCRSIRLFERSDKLYSLWVESILGKSRRMLLEGCLFCNFYSAFKFSEVILYTCSTVYELLMMIDLNCTNNKYDLIQVHCNFDYKCKGCSSRYLYTRKTTQ